MITKVGHSEIFETISFHHFCTKRFFFVVDNFSSIANTHSCGTDEAWALRHCFTSENKCGLIFCAHSSRSEDCHICPREDLACIAGSSSTCCGIPVLLI